MKANNFFKIGFFATAFVLLSAGIRAQNYTPFTATGTESIDTVTVGSRMPYKMAGDPTIAKISTLSSEFKWAFYSGYLSSVSGSPLTWTINKGTTTGAATAGADQSGYPNYYTDKEINVTMPGTAGAYSLVVNERTIITATNTAGCVGDDSIAKIQVVDKPKLTWPSPAAANDCDPQAVTIPITLFGYGQWQVSYTVSYIAFGASGTPAVIATETNVPIGNVVKAEAPGKSYNLVIPASSIDNGQTDKSGMYTVNITGLTDRISRKSLDPAVMASSADMPLSAYTINIYPKPKTKKLEHVRNMQP